MSNEARIKHYLSEYTRNINLSLYAYSQADRTHHGAVAHQIHMMLIDMGATLDQIRTAYKLGAHS